MLRFAERMRTGGKSHDMIDTKEYVGGGDQEQMRAPLLSILLTTVSWGF